MNAQELKVGSIVRMSFWTYSNEIKKDWTIIKKYNTSNNDEMIVYVADCVVSNVTAKFFRVIIPHLNNQSVRMSKNCFIDTKSSYADIHNFRAEIVSI